MSVNYFTALFQRLYGAVTSIIALLMRFYRDHWRLHNEYDQNGKNVKNMQTHIHFSMTDVRQQVGLLLAYMQDKHIQIKNKNTRPVCYAFKKGLQADSFTYTVFRLHFQMKYRVCR